MSGPRCYWHGRTSKTFLTSHIPSAQVLIQTGKHHPNPTGLQDTPNRWWVYVCVCVRESQSHSPPSTAITRSQSPEFWSLVPAVPHQHSYKLHTLSDTHRPVYGSLYGYIPDSLQTYLCFASLLDSPAIFQRIFCISNDSPALIPDLLRTRTPLSCEQEGYQFLHRAPAYIHPYDTHQLITLLFHCISLNKHSRVMLTCCLLALIVTYIYATYI